ncbi:NAD(P)-binding domain-containing protein [Amycolatopsis sp. H20-H5]|uniref:NAD(P)-binding domain-containing protein n=1 Tax=Amycolatopsis sp. H20-H5 TaxID=3046309 RepID=UPI002DBE7DA2|nr:NAD(P)-binding domain-containing protein [Amycolatopsis sp. H20-H5]MEC3979441.1 NAD(P)-binding domain-containing protein [Amycolatopsis sp. H20-H5]
MTDEVLDYLVVGAGPAGLQLAYFLERAGHSYQVLEGGAGPGTFFTTNPRHRTLISVNKVHTGWDDPELNLRMDWNSLLSDDPELLFPRYSDAFFPAAADLLRYLADFAGKHALRVRYDTWVERIHKDDDGVFVVTDTAGTEFRATRLVVATGVSKPYIPDIPGIELVDQYNDVSVDPAEFTDQRVLIIGKANSAFETADNLIASAAVVHVGGPNSLKLAWRTHFVGHLRALNNNLLDAYQLKLQHAVLDGHVRDIRRDGDGFVVTFGFIRAEEVRKEIRYDRVISCTGFRFDASIFDEAIRPELTINDRFPAQTSAWESVNVPGLYFAGTITQVRDFKKSTSGFIHGFRYGVRALQRILDERHHDRPWPHRRLTADLDELTGSVITRINRTSALYQQFGFLADVLVVDGEEGRYYEEVPVDHFAEGRLSDAEHAFVITLDYGPDHDKVDPFDISVRRASQDVANDAGEGHYLHPIVRHYRRGELVAAHHITENLDNEWDKPQVHVKPLKDFLARRLATVDA